MHHTKEMNILELRGHHWFHQNKSSPAFSLYILCFSVPSDYIVRAGAARGRILHLVMAWRTGANHFTSGYSCLPLSIFSTEQKWVFISHEFPLKPDTACLMSGLFGHNSQSALKNSWQYTHILGNRSGNYWNSFLFAWLFFFFFFTCRRWNFKNY